MDAVRLIHFADLHLGVESGGRPDPETGLNQRIRDVCDRLDELCAVAEEEGVHAVLFAGDAFKHQHPTPTLQRLFAERMRRLVRAGVRVFLLVGNHDLPKMAALSHPFSIYDALEIPEVLVGDRAGIYRLPMPSGAPAPELQIGALPHFSRHQVLARLPEETDDPDAVIQEQLAATVRGLGDELDPSTPAVFCGHCHVNQAEVGRAQALFGIADVEVSLSTLGSAFPYYALGHVHRRQVLSAEPFVAYSGSLERVDFGEGAVVDVGAGGEVRVARRADEKGFYLFDLVEEGGGWRLAAEPRFHPVGARSFVTARVGRVEGDDPTGAIRERLERARASGVDLEGAFVKVVCEVDAADRARLRRRELREAVPEAYDLRLALETVTEEVVVRDPRFAQRMGELEALERYLETREEWSDDAGALLELGRELIAEVSS